MIKTYFFLSLKVLNAIAKSCRENWKIARTKTCDKFALGKIRYCKDKIASCKLGILQLQKLMS